MVGDGAGLHLKCPSPPSSWWTLCLISIHWWRLLHRNLVAIVLCFHFWNLSIHQVHKIFSLFPLSVFPLRICLKSAIISGLLHTLGHNLTSKGHISVVCAQYVGSKFHFLVGQNIFIFFSTPQKILQLQNYWAAHTSGRDAQFEALLVEYRYLLTKKSPHHSNMRMSLWSELRLFWFHRCLFDDTTILCRKITIAIDFTKRTR